MSYSEKKREYNKKWAKNNPDKVKAIYRRWRESHKKQERERVKKWARENTEYRKKYVQENKEKIKLDQKKYEKQRRKINPKYRLDRNMGSKISTLLKDKKARRTWKELVGYTIESLIKHLEKQFDDKMTWENYGSYWEVDHRKPKSLFKYETAEDLEFKKCWALSNLQPLEKYENRKKFNKF